MDDRRAEARLKWRFIYRGLKTRYRDQRAELLALERGLAPGDVAVDVGANKGGYLWALARGARCGKVVAFEPQPSLADYLARACRAARLDNVVVEAAGVSRAPGELTLIVPGEGDSPDASFECRADDGAARRIPVKVVSLDAYFAAEPGRIGTVKIDVEGHEASVIDGAGEVLRAHRPALVVECEQRHLAGTTVAKVLGLVLAHDYDGWFVRRGRLAPLCEFDPAVHQRAAGGRFWDAPDYCNNFVFRPRQGST